MTERAKFVKVGGAGLERALTGNPDPRALLDALRSQRNDQAVALGGREARGRVAA